MPQNEVSEAKHDAPLKAVTFGVFDLLHFGHFELFRRCKDLIGRDGKLMVAVQLDEYVTKYKPQARLVYDWNVRANMIRALRYVDEVVPYSDIDESIRGFEFDVFVVGADQVHLGIQRAMKWCEEQGKRVVSLSRTEGISSSMLRSIKK